MTNEKFCFRNFEPSDEFIIYANELLKRTMDSAPSDSTSLATVLNVNTKYKARMEIFSGVANFSAITEGDTPELAVDELGEKIAHQITRWRNNRFETQSFKLWPLSLKNLFNKVTKQSVS
ncbi:MAG: hypothetical protein SGI74_01975 [Oligoflexia bacterium]|nr:hypothetical protein [Oligoflexia bacterium]